MTHDIGNLYCRKAADIGDALIAEYELPVEVRSVSVSLDRTSVPMSEPRELSPEKRRRMDAPKHSATRQFRMAWCASLTIHNANSDALHSIRYGLLPKGNSITLCDAMANDVCAILKKRPDMKVVLVANGASEIWDLFRAHSAKKEIGCHIRKLVDFWHMIEKLSAAAKVMASAGAQRLIADWRRRLLKDSRAATRIPAQFRRSGNRQSRAGESRPVLEVITYIYYHVDLMNYAAVSSQDNTAHRHRKHSRRHAGLLSASA